MVFNLLSCCFINKFVLWDNLCLMMLLFWYLCSQAMWVQPQLELLPGGLYSLTMDLRSLCTSWWVCLYETLSYSAPPALCLPLTALLPPPTEPLPPVQLGQPRVRGTGLSRVRVALPHDHGLVCARHHWDVQRSKQVAAAHTIVWCQKMEDKLNNWVTPLCSLLCKVCQRTSPCCGCHPGRTFGCWGPSASPCPSTSSSSMWSLCLWVIQQQFIQLRLIIILKDNSDRIWLLVVAAAIFLQGFCGVLKSQKFNHWNLRT